MHRSSRGIWSTSATSTICEHFPAGIQVTGGSTCVRNLHGCRRHDLDTLDVPLGPLKDFLEPPASTLVRPFLQPASSTISSRATPRGL